MPSDCAVEILLPAFKLGLHHLHEFDEWQAKAPQPEKDVYWADVDQAWDHLERLADAALDAKPSTDAGVALQLALAVDQVTILEACKPDDEQREEICRVLRQVLRNALSRLDLTAVRAAGVIEHYLGERPDAPLGIKGAFPAAAGSKGETKVE